MRIVFLGTGDIAIPTFHALIHSGHHIAALVTQPDKPVGRKQTLTPPNIKLLALQHNIPILQPEKLREKSQREKITALTPDIIIVFAYGQILTENLISSARLACINLHASLLPKYRGAACIQAAIDSGDSHTGITLMHVVKQLDAGDIIASRTIPILPHDTAETLHDSLAHLAPTLLLENLPPLFAGTATRTPQDENLVTHVGKLTREHGLIDWKKNAAQIERRIRAYHTWPSTYTTTHDAKRIKIFPPTEIIHTTLPTGQTKITPQGILVGCADHSLLIKSIQPESGKIMTALDYANRLTNPLQFH